MLLKAKYTQKTLNTHNPLKMILPVFVLRKYELKVKNSEGELAELGLSFIWDRSRAMDKQLGHFCFHINKDIKMDSDL